MTRPNASDPRRSPRSTTAGGRATNQGSRYQASVATFIYVAILAERPLPWFGPLPRVPTAVSAETGGPGDDLRVEFGSAPATGEIQARHNMNAAGDFRALVTDIAGRSGGRASLVALVAARRASDRLFGFAADLDLLRAGADEERLDETVKALLPAYRGTLESLYVSPADFDDAPALERGLALEMLRHRLVVADRAEEAWAILLADALDLSADGSRRDAARLVDLLTAHGISLRVIDKDESRRNQLEWIRTTLIDQQHQQAGIEALTKISRELESEDVSPTVRAEAIRLLAVCFLQLERFAEARDAARRAVELAPEWATTQATYANVLVVVGEPALAIDHADRAVALDATDRRAWIALTRVKAATGVERPDPPAPVAADPEFKSWLVPIRRQQERWQEVLDLTRSLLADPLPSPHTRYFHAEALVALAPDDPSGESELRQAVDELGALIGSVHAVHPILTPAYFLRARARARLGDRDGAAADEDALQRVNRDEPKILEQTAGARALRGDLDGALRMLETTTIPLGPSLLAMRAGFLAMKGRGDEARRDLAAAADSLPIAEEPDLIAYQLGEVAIDLGDLDRARALRAGMSAGSRSEPVGEFLAGQIAFADGDIETARLHYSGAIARETDATKRRLLRLRLGMQLRAAHLPRDAMAVFQEAGLDNLEDDELQPYIVAAFEAGDLVEAKRGIDRLAANGPLATWALSVRADIGLRTDDPEAVVGDLLAMEQQGANSARIHLTLARCLIELGRMDEALARVQTTLMLQIAPRDRLEAAIYLKRLGQTRQAIAELFQAFRDDRGDPRIQRTLATMVFAGGVELEQPTAVAAGSHVRLARSDGSKREHTVFAEPPYEKAVGDLSVEEAQAAGIFGLRLDENLVRPRHPLPDEVWTVEEIVPAEVHAARTIVATFEDTFPDEPFFVVSVRVGDGDKVDDLTGLMSMLGERRERVAKVFQLYHQQGFPLEFIANMLQASVPELMAGAAHDASLRPLLVEWGEASGASAAVAAAGETTTIVLTRSALFSARRFGLLDLLHSTFDLIVPTSLIWQLREEVEEAARRVSSGHSTMMAGPAGPAVIESEPNAPALISALDDANDALAWVLASTRQFARPLESFSGTSLAENRERDQDQVRNQLGPASFDAVSLAEHGLGVLYADDLGLRRYSTSGAPPPAGFSTVTLVPSLVARGLLTAEEGTRIEAELVLAGYIQVPPSDELLAEAVRRMPGLGRAGLHELFGTLGGQITTPVEATLMVGRAIKRAALQSIELVSAEDVAEAGILGLARRVRRGNAAAAIAAIAKVELRFLPSYLARVTATCDRLGIEEPRALET